MVSVIGRELRSYHKAESNELYFNSQPSPELKVST